MNRRLPHYALAALLAASSSTQALEVGEIQVQSALNQLFDATIPLPTLAPEDLNSVSIKIASPAMFNEFGLDRTPTLSHLVFSIQYDAEGRVYVKAVSTQPIREPSLALLLEFSWPRGKTFREFTVLLDPVRRLAERPTSRSKTVLNTQETPEATTIPSYKPGDFYGPVSAGEGLWGIALKLRPEGITREQMMQTLFQINPQAFANENVSGLKTGAKLRIPTYKEIADATGSPIALQLSALEARSSTMPVADSAQLSPDTPVAFPLTPSIIPEPVVIAEAAHAITSATPPTRLKTTTLITQLDSAPTPETSPTPLLSMAAAEFLLDAQQLLLATIPSDNMEKHSIIPADSTVAPIEDAQPAHVAPTSQADTIATLLSATTAENMLDEANQLLADVLQTALPQRTPLPVTDAQSSAVITKATATPTELDKPDEAVNVLLPALDLDMALDAMRLFESLLPVPTLKTTPISLDSVEQKAPLPPARNLAKQPDPVPINKSDLPAKTIEPDEDLEKTYKGGGQYVPISNNERLWDIAGKVSPNPKLGRDVVMKALFMANPQAFAKPNIDSLKIGAILRVPTAEEIAKYAATPEAKPAPVPAQKTPQNPRAKN